MRLTGLVQILEQLLAGKRLAAGDDPGQPPVVHADLLDSAALAPVPEPDVDARERDMPVAEGREPEGSVGARVFLVPDPHGGRF